MNQPAKQGVDNKKLNSYFVCIYTKKKFYYVKCYLSIHIRVVIEYNNKYRQRIKEKMTHITK